MDYLPRVVDDELTRRLGSAGAVLIEGPKASGKTMTARQAAASEVLLDVDSSAREAVALDPGLVLQGDTPRLIDEWQVEPTIWNHLRRAVDDRRQPGQFILTGSAVPADDITRHTGAGRISRLRMRTLTLWEAGQGTGEVSLGAVLAGKRVRSADVGVTLRDVARWVAEGGWPGHQSLTTDQRLQAVRDYLDEVRRADISRVDETHRDPERVGRLLRSLARNVATEVAATTLARDAGGPDGALYEDTVREYLDALERLMVVENQPAWSPHLRSRSRLRRAAKRHFVDPSLAVAALGADGERLLSELGLLGLLFESLVVRDLRVHGQALDATVYHYRDNTGLEIDAIVQAVDGRWAAFEVKLGGVDAVDAAAGNLHRLVARVDTGAIGQPMALGVVVATGYGYQRDDGVAVIPLPALAP